jgi:hypothetical protein
VILCLGLKSSGSTWLYNVVIQLMAERARLSRAPKPRTEAFYADNFAMIPAGADRAAHLVIKCHEPSDAIMFLTRFAQGRILLTVREPRDAVASLMKRFRHAFEPSTADMKRQSARITELARIDRMSIFRYEDGFHEHPATIDEMASLLGFSISGAARERIFRSLTREAVRKKISALKKRGGFGRTPNADSFDPATHWHPGHVGDARIGKFETILSAEQQRKVLAATRDYCRMFGYATALGTRRPARR